MPRNGLIRRTLVVAATGAAVALPAAPAAAARNSSQVPCVPGVTCQDGGSSSCRNAGTEPAKGNLAAARRATVCLINRERTERGLPRLRANRSLRGVATKYARSMVRQDFFGHVSPGGSTFIDRIKRSAYLRSADGYKLGENIAWGSGAMANPERIVRSWMNSPGHRANILDGGYRDIGMGVVIGVPVAGGGLGATYVNEFGRRG